MGKVVVICGGLRPPRPRNALILWLDVADDAPPEQRVHIKIDRLLKVLVDDPPDAIVDLLEIAAYVYIADRLAKREDPTMSGMGAHWRRQFQFHIPVRRPDVWNRPDLNAVLTETLSFLSEDTFAFTFEPLDDAMRRQTSLTFDDPAAQKFAADSVLMFSGGLDSLAGAASEVAAHGRRAVLVAHQSANAIAHRQNALADALQREIPPNSILYLPVWVRKGDQEPIEHTQRLRSFLFAALGITISHLFNQDRLLFFENGITSFNLPVAEHVIGSRASRTTHPRVLKSMAKLATLLLERSFVIENPFLWMTKAEVVAGLAEQGLEGLIPLTTSCAQVRQLSVDQRQCGVCSQCVERRFALLAAGLGDTEPLNSYSVDLFEGPYEPPRQAAMAAHHIRQAHDFTRMSRTGFAATHGEIFRTLSSLPGTSRDNIARIHDLHRRNGREIVGVVNGRLQAAVTLDTVLGTSAKSLLPILTSTPMDEAGFVEPAGSPELVRGEKPNPPTIARKVILAVDEKDQRIRFDGGSVVGGTAFGLIRELVRKRQEEITGSTSGNQTRFVRTSDLAKTLKVDEEALRRQVHRARGAINTAYFKVTGYDLDQDDVIQGRRWSGYRLNPYVLIVDSRQIERLPSPASRLSRPLVTTRIDGPRKG